MNEHAEDRRGLPEVVVLYCRRCVKQGAVAANVARERPDCRVRLMILPCSSKVEPLFVMRLLENGAEAVEIAACPEGQCRFLVGNVKAERRLGHVRRFLDEMALSAQRVGLTRGSGFTEEDLLRFAAGRLQQASRPTP
ncbi:MAG: hydrogenase iron-sulfur subunit [Verrucomicrobiota bacterium]|nr:hydrogenase iron-sulfur subunit [Verrucomicrobiota bacterium]